ncbi:hypothetical protein [Streptomyces sp. BK205]|uniref:hypothetical protein n=1 Tax=Streptomyces TaxID=1883 RepID=UPI001042B999|nr:hypothetical protein [Streptomyces sp. BK205]TCR17176.1 hypothetical protein EV578_11263 [Streptomyces sp. BK205]
MSAENETYDSDALMAAITGEELGDEARSDSAFLAEYRAAEADIALLRQQLGFLGETFSETPSETPSETRPAPKPLPARLRTPSRARRRARTLAFGTLAVAATAGVFTGFGWLLGHSGADDRGADATSDSAAKAEAGVRFGGPEYLACATTVAEGRVTAVEELPAGQVRVTVRVSHSYVPTHGPKDLTYVVDTYDLPEPLTRGTAVLFGVSQGSPAPDHWVVGTRRIAQERAWITASLPESRTLPC